MWVEITYLFPNFNGCTVDVWEFHGWYIRHILFHHIYWEWVFFHYLLYCYFGAVHLMGLGTWLTSWQIRKIAGCACVRNAGNVFPAIDLKKPLVIAIPACIMARAWRTCRDALSGSLTRVGGENDPGIPGACATPIFAYLARGSLYEILPAIRMATPSFTRIFGCLLQLDV